MILDASGFRAQSARSRVLDLFSAQGISGSRVQVRPAATSKAEQLARYSEVDVALDVFPCNGRTPICEALWMGVPVVTRAGKSHAARVGASILHSAGLSQYIADTEQRYIDIAAQLAQDVKGRRELRAQMRQRLRSSRLLDGARLARDLEMAYLEVLSRKAHAAQPIASSAESNAAVST
jgi:predicted O-linked N-acetylglucosamine transferase (SPINDLY family)